MAKKVDAFRSGAVKVSFKKDFPYMDSKGKAIEGLEPQFKKGDQVTLHYRKAGELTKAGFCEILDEKLKPISTVEAAKEK